MGNWGDGRAIERRGGDLPRLDFGFVCSMRRSDQPQPPQRDELACFSLFAQAHCSLAEGYASARFQCPFAESSKVDVCQGFFITFRITS